LLERLGTITPVIVDDAVTLMDEIRGDALAVLTPSAPTPPVDAYAPVRVPVCAPHTVPDIQSPSSDISPEKNMWGTHSQNPDEVFDFDKK